METDPTLIERERCKAIIIRKFDSLIKRREEKIKRKRRIIKATFERLKDNVLFLIDNPNYVRKKGNTLT